MPLKHDLNGPGLQGLAYCVSNTVLGALELLVHLFFPLTPWDRCCCSSHLAGKETEAGRGEVVCTWHTGDKWSRN